MNETISTILSIGGVGGIVFGVYHYFKNPQINSDKTDAVFSQRLEEIQKEIASFGAGFQAHLQSDITSFNSLNAHIVEVDKSVVRLTTIIEERIPMNRRKK